MPLAPDLRIGIDVGGTHTDAVLLNAAHDVKAKVKVPTTADVTSGVRAALDGVLDRAGDPAVAARVTHVMVGSTHAMNAILERRRLQKVAVLRLAAPTGLAVRPLIGWPAELRDAVLAGGAIIGGGHEVDGREIAPLDVEAAKRFLGEMEGVADAVAITGAFSPADPEHELRARDVAREVLGADVTVALGHEVGTLGLIERENAAVLNAALTAVARAAAQGVADAVTAQGLDAQLLFTQNDGTLMSVEAAARTPVLTIGSGLANSMRGAAFLSRLRDGLVVDVGGTSSDVAALEHGFPRESAIAIDIGGARTNFRMPDIVSIGVGGGSIVRPDADVAGGYAVGPQSVGAALPTQGLVFGGATTTLTDAAVRAGRVAIGDVAPPADLDADAILARAGELLANAVDRARTAPQDVPLVAVGGGSFLVPDALPGISEVLRPDHHDVANAVGAAIAQVSGQIEEVVSLNGDRAEKLEEARGRAIRRAVEAGADGSRTEVVELDEVPLAYMTEPIVRLRVKAVGPLRTSEQRMHHA
ncbi:MAG TPA: hydantoinase/oxoprolinase family protein [Baekduia sp.]|uniref:hydantoinase/oxoprolinase family protein n=1 Tax=Baekduia sp. TaxID=2600305 RepID=UPI002D778957|nr:hydantoinase/oxoprolinase family protein [Baekduia sp.]HET6505286.1 hydantoinase/oxoprolinase family protein [Baekduia sp.]